jgi:hypothetical protein
MVSAIQNSLGNGVLDNTHGHDFSHCGNLEIKNSTLTGRLNNSGTASLQSSDLNHIQSSGTLNLVHSVANTIFSSGSCSAADCPRIGSIISSGSTSLSRCKEIGAITVSGGFSLVSSKVHGKVVVSGEKAEISDSSIENTLESSNRTIKVANSSIREIVLKPCKNSRSFSGFFTSEVIVPQTVILAGKSCKIDRIRFEDGATGKVILNDVVALPEVSGGQIER